MRENVGSGVLACTAGRKEVLRAPAAHGVSSNNMFLNVAKLRNVGCLDSLTRSIDGAPPDADQALYFNNPYKKI